ncbi:MAG TPA: 2-phospho-L-lactate transferase CofD family protein [Patescibacteria group bacterium]|nr:2-phospho-L-lactate transferase CofD family protein [Patescibacteria group bacterium]
MAIEQTNRLNICGFGGGSGGSVLGVGLANGFPDANVSIVVPMGDGGGGTKIICKEFGGPAFGDVSKIVGETAANEAAGDLFANQRFSEATTTEDIRELNERMLGNLVTTGKDTDRASRLLDDVAALSDELIARRRGLRSLRYGNLILTALRLDHGDDSMAAVREANGLLDTRVDVVPVTATPHNVVMYDPWLNQVVIGEGRIDDYVMRAHPTGTNIWLEAGEIRDKIIDDPHEVAEYLASIEDRPAPTISTEAAAVIMNAHVVVIGPGSQRTSIAPALKPTGAQEAFAEQARHKGSRRVGIMNLKEEATTPGLTFEASVASMRGDMSQDFTHLLYNTDTAGLSQGSVPIYPASERLVASGTVIIGASLVGGRTEAHPDDTVAHLRTDMHHDMSVVTETLRTQVLQEVTAFVGV